jgi:hypothetical protein
MRLALAFSAARWLTTPQQRRMFREGLEELPSEVVLYWFTLCFYGYRQSAGRAALRMLLTHEEPAEQDEKDAVIHKRRRPRAEVPTLFSMASRDQFAEGQETPSADVASESLSMDMESVASRDVAGIPQGRTTKGTLQGGRTRRRRKGQEEVQ